MVQTYLVKKWHQTYLVKEMGLDEMGMDVIWNGDEMGLDGIG